MKKFAFLSDGYIAAMAGAGAALNVALWYYLHSSISPDAAFVTLHFTTASGVDLIGQARELYFVPYWVALLSLLNVALARILYHYDTLLAYVLVSALPVLNGFALFSGHLLVVINS